MSGVGIFGGTFDPIHIGHLRSAREVCDQLSLDAMQFVPTANPVHRKPPVAPSEARLSMIEQSIRHEPTWSVNDCELCRPGPSYMVDTISSIRSQFGSNVPLWLLVGSDAFEGFVTWHRWKEILCLTNVAVMVRAGIAPVGCEQTQLLLKHPNNKLDPVAGDIRLLSVTALNISSTSIRSDLLLGRSPEFLVMPEVLGYIRAHHLYQV